MTEGLPQVRHDHHGAMDVLEIAGKLDLASAPDLERAVNGALNGETGEFRLDLRGVTFMDLAGARALLWAQNNVESFGRHFVLIAPTRPVRHALEIFELDRVLDIRA
jgi:anti-sigma B factor antagonist